MKESGQNIGNWAFWLRGSKLKRWHQKINSSTLNNTWVLLQTIGCKQWELMPLNTVSLIGPHSRFPQERVLVGGTGMDVHKWTWIDWANFIPCGECDLGRLRKDNTADFLSPSSGERCCFTSHGSLLSPEAMSPLSSCRDQSSAGHFKKSKLKKKNLKPNRITCLSGTFRGFFQRHTKEKAINHSTHYMEANMSFLLHQKFLEELDLATSVLNNIVLNHCLDTVSIIMMDYFIFVIK